MSDRRLGDTFWLAFAVHDIVSQARADALAVAAYVFEDGTDVPIHTPAVGQYAPAGVPVTGLYRFGVVATVGNGFEYGKSYNAVAIYTAPNSGDMGVEQVQICERFTLDSKLAGDLNDIAGAGVQAAMTAQGYTTGRAPKLDNLDTTVGSRAVAADVTAGLTAQGYTTGRAPKLDNLDAAITTRAAPADLVNLDVAVSTRAPEAGGNVAAIKGKTDLLPADPASESGALAKDATVALDATVAKEATLAGTPAATSAAVTAAHGVGSYVDSGAAPAVGDIDAQLSATHGAGSWEGGGASSPDIPVILAIVNRIKMLVEQIFKRLGLRWEDVK